MRASPPTLSVWKTAGVHLRILFVSCEEGGQVRLGVAREGRAHPASRPLYPHSITVFEVISEVTQDFVGTNYSFFYTKKKLKRFHGALIGCEITSGFPELGF